MVAHFQPVQAVLGLVIPSHARFRSGRALLMTLQAGLIPRRTPAVRIGGFFVHKILCTVMVM